jgi:hypothetical protein
MARLATHLAAIRSATQRHAIDIANVLAMIMIIPFWRQQLLNLMEVDYAEMAHRPQ